MDAAEDAFFSASDGGQEGGEHSCSDHSSDDEAQRNSTGARVGTAAATNPVRPTSIAPVHSRSDEDQDSQHDSLRSGKTRTDISDRRRAVGTQPGMIPAEEDEERTSRHVPVAGVPSNGDKSGAEGKSGNDTRRSPPGAMAKERPEETNENCCVACFAAISVYGLEKIKDHDHDSLDIKTFIRVIDQHGHRQETTARILPRGDRAGRCTTWCEELEMSILPDVDGILFELMLSKPLALGGLVGHDLQSRSVTNRGSRREKPTSDSNGATPPAGIDGDGAPPACGGQAPCNNRRNPSHNFACVRVGAVALLFTDVAADTWRTLESPLFNSAGGTIGRIKMAARLLGGPREADGKAGSGDISTAINDVAPAAASVMPAGSPVSPTQETEDMLSALRNKDMGVHNLTPSRTSTCCSHTRADTPEGVDTSSSRKNKQSVTGMWTKGGRWERDFEMTPRATILYRGLRLPLRWFRSSTSTALDEALRETLGINDISLPSPWLYDVSNGNRVHLKPGSRSGLTLLAILEDPSPESLAGRSSSSRPGHKRYVSSSTFSPDKTKPGRYGAASGRVQARNQSGVVRKIRKHKPRRSLSVGDKLSQAGAANLSLPKHTAGSTVAPTTARGVPGYVVAERAAAREKVLEMERESGRERERSRAVVCRLFGRMCCYAEGRAKAEVLWRWRSQVVRSRLEEQSRKERSRECQQTTALLLRLRQEVALLSVASQERLLEVSIDALEKDLTQEKYRSTESYASEGGAVSLPLGGQRQISEKENVDRAVASLETDISGLRALQAQERQCSMARIQEAQGVQEATTCGARITPVTTAVGSARAERPRSSIAPAQPFLGSQRDRRSSTDAGDRNRALETGSADVAGTDRHARSSSKINNSRNTHARYDRDCDDLLKVFLARHDEDFIFEEDGRERHPRCCNPRRDGSPRMPDDIQSDVRGEGGSGDGKDLRVVMWAVFRAFADSPPFPDQTFNGPTPPAATARRSHLRCTPTDHGVGDHCVGGMSLSAFLDVGRRARLVLCARSAWHGNSEDGSRTKGGKRRGRGGCWADGSGLAAVATAEAEMGGTDCVLDPAIVTTVYKRIVKQRRGIQHTRGASPLRAVCNSARCGSTHRGVPALSPRRRRQRSLGSASQSGIPERNPFKALPCDDVGPTAVTRDSSYGSNDKIFQGLECHHSEQLDFQQFRTGIQIICGLLARRDDGSNARGTSKTTSESSVHEVGLWDEKQALGRDKWGLADTSPEKNIAQRIGSATSVGAKARKLAKSCLVRLAKELAMQQLHSKDLEARETLALLDPLAQEALGVNREILLEIFRYYCRRYQLLAKPLRATRGVPKYKDGSRSVLRLCFEGGQAFARDFCITPLVVSVQQLAELWHVAWSHQHQDGGERAEGDGRCVLGGLGNLMFTGFLDLLGRYALRLAERRTYGQRSEFSFSNLATLRGHEAVESYQTTPGQFHLVGLNPGRAILAFLEAMQVSRGCEVILGSVDGCGGVRRGVLERGFLRP